MAETKRLYRVKRFAPMWMTNDELQERYQRHIYNFINISGRLGGKTFNIVQMIGLTIMEKPKKTSWFFVPIPLN